LKLSRAAVPLVLAVLLPAGAAHAVPAFARQTGMTCAQCHTIFPELTPFGRNFKAGGYTFAATKQLVEGGATEEQRKSLEVNAYAPLGVMLVAAYTHTAEPQRPAGAGSPAALNDDIALPQEFSLFYAGKVTPKLGVFSQFTYSQPDGTFGLDNTDIRFAHQMDVGGTPLILGATINNSPTVTDLWNSTPVWGYPSTGSLSAPGANASTLVEEQLAQQAVGLGIYGFWNGMVYAEFDVYRSAPQRIALPIDLANEPEVRAIQTLAPYWRVALEKTFDNTHSVMLGTFGLHAALLPGGSTDPAGPADVYTDVGVDAQYQYITDKHILSGTLTYIHEWQTLNATNAAGGSDNLLNDLHTFKANVGYIYDRMIGARLVLSTVRGSQDSTLYGAGTPMSGGTGPRTTSLTAEVVYTPWLNWKIGAQYIAFFEQNGRALDYDGNGRNAAANNTVYAYVWVAY
jgi:hypothetical protein